MEGRERVRRTTEKKWTKNDGNGGRDSTKWTISEQTNKGKVCRKTVPKRWDDNLRFVQRHLNNKRSRNQTKPFSARRRSCTPSLLLLLVQFDDQQHSSWTKSTHKSLLPSPAQCTIIDWHLRLAEERERGEGKGSKTGGRKNGMRRLGEERDGMEGKRKDEKGKGTGKGWCWVWQMARQWRGKGMIR
ncbi:hypothetical protein niasHT_027311 [Heterodera trifolii]|uniref:Uncharacterized protein n=1 Tax=Heterodera trifolii TaxID=157864 RepID=A0ABD2JUA6_9BILA